MRLYLKKEINRLRLKLLQIARKTIMFEYYLNVVVVDIQELITINYLFRYNIKQL